MIEQLKNIWQRRELLWYIVRFQMKAENKILGFAIAIYNDKDIMLIDEMMSGGDAAFRQKADVEMSRIIGERMVVTVSHSIPTIERFANKIIGLDRGVIPGMAETNRVIEQYMAAAKIRKPPPDTGDWAVA